ncbi:MAG: tetratricopeptide repeat protein [Bacteroidia bacterium]|nr:tetratricopeptide repeat protein [Bacteroidia bacterium]MBP9180303.1 tetratricopeptide repeat protein [Bacteroidia bacterium]
MKRLLTLLILTNNFVFGQQLQDNTAMQTDTSNWKYIRDKIKDETFFINLSPSGEYYYNRGKLKGQIQDYEGAIADLNKSIELNSKEPVVYYTRGAVKERMGDLKGAREDFTKVIELQSDFAWGWNDRGQINSKLEKFDEAEADFKKAIELKPAWSVPVFNLGLLNERKKDFNKAIDFYSQSIKIDSTNYLGYNNIGHLYFQLKDYDHSISYYTQAIKIFPKYLNAIKNRADARIAKGDKEGACKDLKLAADLGDTNAGKYFYEFCTKK